MILTAYRVALGTVRLGETDDAGVTWIVEDLEGWHATGSTGEVTQRTGRNGGWRNRAYLAARGMTLKGSVVSPLPNVGDLIDQLIDSVPLDVPAPMTVYGVTGDDRVAYVRQEGTPAPQILSPYAATFEIGLVAPDALKYSSVLHIESTKLPMTFGGLKVPFKVPFAISSVTVSGVLSAYNAGNAVVAPRVIIYGPVTTPRVTHVDSGAELVINLTLGAGEYIDLDLGNRTAYLNGTASRRGFVSGQWFSLQRGDNLIAFNSPTYSPDAELQVIWRDAWK
ncbi:phage distal tail protein [Kribbella sp. WER1]